ncbi:MAG: glycoside hydrolase family 2, partial [Bacteroidaceae bacterium]|nr:glycoside hydrolase family 2 [Bacteroidaceae bacterium]
PVCTVSGGVNIKSDIWSTHNYEQDPKKLKDIIYNGERWFQTPCDVQDIPRLNVGFNRAKDNNLFDFPTYDKADMPYILDEFGGIKWVKGQDTQTGNSPQSWGYGEPPHSLEEFYARLEGQVDGLMSIAENVWGYCYTQLTDVEQEQNGIYFYDRTSKFDMNRIKAIFSKRPASSKE